ncbi:hypothetical protein SFC66_12505 [Terribacillus saccharophilus]|uniref:hypothetical protein n=1 Tax=Terribacillus saccharophilus TaxID=361277 RepID=UPI003981B793
MLLLMDACNLLFSYVNWRSVDEDDIQMNIEQLKRTDWFQQYLHKQPYRDLIVFDKAVRNTIGRLTNKRLVKNPHRQAYQRILTKALHRRIIITTS